MEVEREYFWNTYKQILIENGEPFSLKLYYNMDGTLRYYARLKRKGFSADRYINIEFSPESGMVRYGFYLDNDIVSSDYLFEHKEAIESALGFRCSWKYNVKGENMRCIICEKEIIPYDRDSYLDAIEESMLRITKFLEVFGSLLNREEKHTTEFKEERAMKTFKTGDLFKGTNFTDMFNNTLGTRYKAFMKCWLRLKNLGCREEGIFWFVFMNGTVHGTHKDYLWRNILSSDGNTIEEECVAEDKSKISLYVPQNELRVSFQRDPFGTDDKYLCKFIGVFQISDYRENKNSFVRIFKRIADTYTF